MGDDIDALTGAHLDAVHTRLQQHPAYQAALEAEVSSAWFLGWSLERLTAEIKRRKQLLEGYEAIAREPAPSDIEALRRMLGLE
jgi:hypothetical protein